MKSVRRDDSRHRFQEIADSHPAPPQLRHQLPSPLSHQGQWLRFPSSVPGSPVRTRHTRPRRSGENECDPSHQSGIAPASIRYGTLAKSGNRCRRQLGRSPSNRTLHFHIQTFFLERELGCVHANDNQARIHISRCPALDVRQRAQRVDTRVGPEIGNHHLSSE